MSTEVSDEGTYLCHVSTFPSGNFEMGISITVWTVPISSLEPEILVEGQSYREAAYCRSVAHPTPRLSWDTDLNGQSTNHVSDNGVVTSRYSLHPLRNMNGMKLDCLVWHPTRAEPRRLTNKLVVHFPPNPEIVGYNEKWHVGFENAAVKCVSKGNPEPQMTWTREGGELPEGVTPHPNGTLAFRRPLSPSDAGTYRCVAKNDVGVASETVEIILTETAKIRISENMLMIIVGATAGGLLILMVVAIIVTTRHHKRRNKKTGEGADREEEHAQCRDSRSTISGGRVGGAFDHLGRPMLHNNSRRTRERHLDIDEENQLRVETFQESRFCPPLVPSPFPVLHSTELLKHLNGRAIVPGDADSQQGSTTKANQHAPLSCSYPPATDDEDEVDEGLGGPASQENQDDQDSETNSSHVSEACSMRRYQQTNGTLRPKLHPKPGQIGPHTSTIHKAQIV
ncbi:unnamed protein product [Tetraodon nigroviridis]|uniref:(spotted green pufferfish) hypothetical protein n=1 Tax=Tetraodon nigroviridis TaxID=99883 RepID=Q4T6S3_TETNG|nr:unnamed protein product [Tetraodon nigroviridis]